MRADNEERRPLLPRATSITSSSSHQNDNTSPSISSISSAETSPSPHVENVPIPYLRLFPIFLIRIAVPLTYSLIFPSIVPYLEHLKVPTGEIGLYAGIAEGSFMIVSAITAPIWGRLADRYGRKRCVIYGWLIGIVASALVGFGRGRRGVWWVIFWRGAAGINPTGVLARVLIAEISHPTNRARIFALYSPISSIGMMLGSLCGGGLAMPYGRLPAWLGGRSQILREWPFALPCLVGVGFSAISLIICQIMLEETRPPQDPTGASDGPETRVQARSTISLMKEIMGLPKFGLTISIYASLMFAMFSFDGIFVIYVLTPIQSGGLGLTASTSGILTSLFILSFILISPFLGPHLQSRLGFRNTLSTVTGIIPLEALMIPLGQYVARASPHSMVCRLAVLVLQGEMKCFHLMGWPMSDQLMISLFDSYPYLLATGSAMTSIVGTTCRAFSPGITGWIFSISTQFPTLSFGRQLSWIVLLVLSLPPVILSRKLEYIGKLVHLREKKRVTKHWHQRLNLTTNLQIHSADSYKRRASECF